MLPSMRYQTKKLAQLYHKRKSFQDHRSSIHKIKHKEMRSPSCRSRELNQLRDRMHNAFNYTQMVRARDIRKDNVRLYQQCFCGKNMKKVNSPNPQGFGQSNTLNNTVGKSRQRVTSRTGEMQSRQMLLKNHRSSPINKMTGYDRARENLRLAIKISQPCPAINTKKLQKIHEEARKHKERIMRYDSSAPKFHFMYFRSSRYIDKRLSVSSLRSSKNEYSSPKNGTKQANMSTFRTRNNFQKSYAFSLTEYQK